jgi:SAM-dependent methyltransferase
MDTKPHHLSWYLSAIFYRFTFIGIANQVDEEMFAYLGGKVKGAVVADCGCGPGALAAKLLRRGARRVVAIDGNGGMLSQVAARLPEAVNSGHVIPVQARFSAELFERLVAEHPGIRGFDLALFKRSLYMPRGQAVEIVRAAAEHLNPGGKVVVIHPERSLRRYAFGPGMRVRSYTPYHLVNRTLSRLGQRLGLGEYAVYTREELVGLVEEAARGRAVEVIPSKQRAYNLVAVGSGTGEW